MPVEPGSQLTIGDTHGNSMKLIYFLIRQGVLKLRGGAKEYHELVKIYQKVDLTAADLAKFDDIINRAILTPGASIRLIGDEVGDRGANDYFNLKIIEKLNKGEIPVETLYSDHGAEFIDFYEKGCPPGYKAPNLQGGQARSVENLSKLVEQGLITSEKLQTLIKNNYIPNLKLISYTIDEVNSHITLHSHAPVGLETIEQLAKKFDIPYQDNSPKALAETIDKINLKFSGLADKRKITQTVDDEKNIWDIEIWRKALSAFLESRDVEKIKILVKSITGKLKIPYENKPDEKLRKTIYRIIMKPKTQEMIDSLSEEENAFITAADETYASFFEAQHGPSGASLNAPLTRVIWSRYANDPAQELEKQKYNKTNYSVSNIHGHDAAGEVPDSCRKHVKNLDDTLGKDSYGTRVLDYTGSYRIHCNFEMSSKQYQQRLSQKTGFSVETVSSESVRASAQEAKILSEDERITTEAERVSSEVESQPRIEPSLVPTPPESAGLAPDPRLSESTMPEPDKMILPAAKTATRRDKDGIVAGSEITPEKIQSSFNRIQQNIEGAKKGEGPEENKIYKNATIVSADPNNLSVKMNYGNKVDEMTRTVVGKKMITTLSKDSEDSSFLLFCDMNKEFSPLKMKKPCKDPSLELPLKVLEAAIIRGIDISLSEEDKQKFEELPETDPRKKHYELIQNNPEDFLTRISGMERKLGQPFSLALTLTARRP